MVAHSGTDRRYVEIEVVSGREQDSGESDAWSVCYGLVGRTTDGFDMRIGINAYGVAVFMGITLWDPSGPEDPYVFVIDGDTIRVWVDFNTGEVWFGIFGEGRAYLSGNPETGTDPVNPGDYLLPESAEQWKAHVVIPFFDGSGVVRPARLRAKASQFKYGPGPGGWSPWEE